MNHGLTSKVLLVTALWVAASTAAHAQWTIDYSVRYEAAGQQSGKPGERRGPGTLVAEKRTWRVLQEVRGTLAYSQKVRGAVASRMPDANNEQCYDSWLHRPGSTGKPAWLKLEAEELLDSAAKLGQADGEGAGEINRQRAARGNWSWRAGPRSRERGRRCRSDWPNPVTDGHHARRPDAYRRCPSPSGCCT